MSENLLQPFIKRKCAEPLADLHKNKKAKLVQRSCTIADLNYYCLDTIFKLLDISGLISMAQVSVMFLQLTTPLIKQKREPISITTAEYSEENRLPPGQWNLLVNQSLIRDLSLGPSISKLFLDSRSICWWEAYDILKRCNGLKELHIRNCREYWFENIKEPFKELEVFSVIDGILGCKLAQLRNWFPKLRNLSLSCIVDDKLYNPDDLKIHTMESMSLSLRSKSKPSSLLNVDGVIMTNPQIKNICVKDSDFGCKPRDLRVICKYVNRLEELKLSVRLNSFKRCTGHPIEFQFVKKLVLLTDAGKMSSLDRVPCPLKFSRLEDLEIGCQFYAEQWFFFAEKNNLKKLKLHSLGFDPDMDFLLKVSKTWPNLTEVTIYTRKTHGLWCTEIFQFIESLKNLKRLNIMNHFRYLYHVDILEKDLPNQFKIIRHNVFETSIVRI